MFHQTLITLWLNKILHPINKQCIYFCVHCADPSFISTYGKEVDQHGIVAFWKTWLCRMKNFNIMWALFVVVLI